MTGPKIGPVKREEHPGDHWAAPGMWFFVVRRQPFRPFWPRFRSATQKISIDLIFFAHHFKASILSDQPAADR
jgi:hypothetical protein